MTQSRATRDLAARKVAAAIYVVITTRQDGRRRTALRQEMRHLVQEPALVTLPPTAARDPYSYRSNKESRNRHHGQKERIARYAGFGSERRLMLFRQAVGQEMLGDVHAECRRHHVIQAGINAGDIWAREIFAAKEAA